MKPVLMINTKNLPEINDAECKKFFELFIPSLDNFHRDYKFTRGVIANEFLIFNQNYIETLFIVVDFLYEYYEFSQRHFELLDVAATNLERLYNDEISKLSSEVEKANKCSALGETLNKVALIFQSAADHTASDFHKKVYKAKTQEYSAKADKLLNIKSPKSPTTKVREIYEKSAQGKVRKFLQETFQRRANEYQEKCKLSPANKNTILSPRLFTQEIEESSESKPLLELRHRKNTPSSSEIIPKNR